MYAVQGEDGSTTIAHESELPPEGKDMLRKAYDNGHDVQRRRVSRWKIDWYKIIGNEIVEKKTWPGKYIPIIRVPGEEITMEGRLDRKGIVRYLKDAQRSFNYNASAALEFGALQSKSPYMAPVEAIEGLENYWSTANSQNHSYLPYNHADESCNSFPQPQRQQPPVSPPVFMDGMQAAEHEMMMASGQYEATFSAQGNEVSGISIEQRQKQGERVTFHYQDNLAKAIRFTGKQLIDLIPKIYDTKRIIRIMDESGEEHSIQVDPQAKQALKQQEDKSEAQVTAIFNQSVGDYDVVAKCGPNFDTRREKAFDAMTQLLAAQPMLANVIGDLYMGTADFPSADKLQERMRNWISSTNPGAMQEGPNPQLIQAQQQLQQASQMIQHLQQQLQDKTIQQTLEKQRLDMDGLEHLAVRMEKEREGLINAFKSETDRLKTLAPAFDSNELSKVIKKTVSEIMTSPPPDVGLGMATTDYDSGLQQVMQPIPALRQENNQDIKDEAIKNLTQSASQSQLGSPPQLGNPPQ
jgi:hypothetical protein